MILTGGSFWCGDSLQGMHRVPPALWVTVGRPCSWWVLTQVLTQWHGPMVSAPGGCQMTLWKRRPQILAGIPGSLLLSGDDLFSTPKLSWSSANSDLGHLWHFLDSNCLPVPEMLQRTSYSKPLPAAPNATTCSFHSNPLPDTPSKGCSESSASSDSAPSDPKSGPMFFRNPPSHSGDRATPTASDIKGRVIKVICNVCCDNR